MVVSANAPEAIGLGFCSDRGIDQWVVRCSMCEPGIGEITMEILALHNADGIAELVHRRADFGGDDGDECTGLDKTACPTRGNRTGTHDDYRLTGDVERKRIVAHVCSPHSFLLCPAQRPARGSSPESTRLVHGPHPIDG